MSEQMVKCGACQTEIAISAKNCPKCGGRNKKYGLMKKRIIGGICLLIAIIWMISDAQRGADKATGAPSSSEKSFD
jgi:hypothetical protein